MHPDEIFELEQLFLDKNNINVIPSGQYINNRPSTNNSKPDSVADAWLSIDRKLIIGTLIIVFLLGFVFAKIIS